MGLVPPHVELAEARDIPAIQALLADTESPFDVEEELHRGYARLWVVRESDVAVAFLLAWQTADEMQLLDVVVALSRRRRGIARALLDALLAFSNEARARHIVLEVRKSNAPAVALYESFAFEVTGERASYYSDGEAALLMTRKVA